MFSAFLATIGFIAAPWIAAYVIAARAGHDDPEESAVLFGLASFIPWLLFGLWLIK